MPKIYNLYYDPQTGIIKSYHEGGAIAPASETPPGLKLLALEAHEHIEIWDKRSFRVSHKVDPVTLHLIPLNAPKILTPPPEEVKDSSVGAMVAATVNTTSGEVVPGVNTNPQGVVANPQSDVHTVRE